MQVEDMVSFGIGAMVEVPCSVQATVESAQLGVYLAMDGIGKQRIAVHKVKTERFGVLVVQYGVSYEEQVDDVSGFQSGYGQLVPFLLDVVATWVAAFIGFHVLLRGCFLNCSVRFDDAHTQYTLLFIAGVAFFFLGKEAEL